MKKTLLAMLMVALLTSQTFADSNGNLGLLNSESVALVGSFDHADDPGDADNGLATAMFSGSFSVNQIRIEGDLTAVIGGTFGSEADIVITDPGSNTVTWANPLAAAGFTGTQAYNGTAAVGPTSGTNWGFEFIDTFSDGPGADSTSSNVVVTFEEIGEAFDENGSFALGSLGTLGTKDTASSVGEMVLGGLIDSYSVTFDTDGILDFNTESDPGGLIGEDADTEIAIFDAAGNFIATNDDGGPGGGFFSGISGLALTAGDYTIQVGTFNTSFGATVNDTIGGTGTGDYALSLSFTASIPEPATAGLLAFAGLGMLIRRRR
jgi:hypothetical protein